MQHKIHPNQVSTWKKQALAGLGSIFEKGPGKGDDREGKVRDLHAKIGELAVQNDFLRAFRVTGDEEIEAVRAEHRRTM